MKRYFLFLLTATLLILPGIARADSGKTAPKNLNDLSLDLSRFQPENKRQNKLSLDRSHPLTVSYLVEYKQFHSKQRLLILGFRPEDDKPRKAFHIIGKKWTDQDWVLEEGSTAIWVTGIPGPTHHDQIILRARLEEKNDSLLLQGYQVIKIGLNQEKRVVLHKDEYVFYALPGSRSNTCPVELFGDSVEIAYYDSFDSIIFEAVKPGSVKLKIFTLWWRDAEPKFIEEHEIVVE